MVTTSETERVRRIWEKLAPRYDQAIGFFEKVLFSGGRQWACSRAQGDVLEFPDAHFDTVVCTLSLCSIPDDSKAVSEARRVLRPGGRFLLLEHVASPIGAVRAIQRVLNLIAVRIEGDHLVREPLVHLRAEGFEIEQLERLKWGIVERTAARKSG